MLEQTRAHLERNRALLASSRVLIARSRRGLNPFFAVSGGAAPTLQETVRALIANGMVPMTGKIYGGYGTGKRCVVCHFLVPPTEVEFEVIVPVNRSVFCHLPCFRAWEEESVAATSACAREGPTCPDAP
jgi:hypothetical protein